MRPAPQTEGVKDRHHLGLGPTGADSDYDCRCHDDSDVATRVITRADPARAPISRPVTVAVENKRTAATPRFANARMPSTPVVVIPGGGAPMQAAQRALTSTQAGYIITVPPSARVFAQPATSRLDTATLMSKFSAAEETPRVRLQH
jgi:hypothetical protein